MKFLSYAKKQFQNRPDSEHRQALLRLAIVSTGMMYGIYILNAGGPLSGFLTIISSFIISITIVAHIIKKPSPSPGRRIIGAIHDNFLTTLFLYTAGMDAALYLFVYPFITVGNGFRFGVRYLAFSGILGILCLSSLVFFNDAWKSDQMVGLGIVLSNILVTLYTGILLKKLKQTQNKLEIMATHDVLTGLPNRACFMDKLESTFQANVEKRSDIVCIYFDLDGFKNVNDVYGHKVGDILLTSVAQHVKNVVRSTDVLARLGGDEFTLLLDTKTTVEDSTFLAQRIINAIESIKKLQGKSIKVSASIGIAHLPASLEDLNKLCPEELLKIADEAMYKAKKSGKGRYELVSVGFARQTLVAA